MFDGISLNGRRGQSLAESTFGKIVLALFFLLVLLLIIALFAWPKLKEVLGALGWA